MLHTSPRVLILEDQPLISIMLEEMVRDVGATIAGIAFSCPEALAMIEADPPDVALLDISLGTETCEPAVAACRSRGVPVVFMTGYPSADLPPFCSGNPALQKPFSMDELQAAVSRAISDAVSLPAAAA
jgi:CheY-like chemotaxis protein